MIGLNNLFATIQTAVTTGLSADAVAPNAQPLPQKPSPLEVFANVKTALNPPQMLATPPNPNDFHTELEVTDDNKEPGSGDGGGVGGAPSGPGDGPPVSDGPPVPDGPPVTDPPVGTLPADSTPGAPPADTPKDPSGSNGWRAGVHPELSVSIDTNPSLASRPNSVHTPDPQDPDGYWGFGPTPNVPVPDGRPSHPPPRIPTPTNLYKQDDDLMMLRR